jgi:uncharacterized protein YdcH (DUF465 family)
MEHAVTATETEPIQGVTAPAPPIPSIEALPAHLRSQLVDKLISGVSSRDVSAWLLQAGHKVSHQAINRYSQRTVRPSIRLGAQLSRIQSLENKSGTDLIDSARHLHSVTKQVVTADPILQRIAAKYARIDRVIDKAEQNEQYSAVAALEAADTRALTLEAQLSGRLQQNSGGNTVVQIAVMAAQPHSAEMPIIDVQIAEVGRRDG